MVKFKALKTRSRKDDGTYIFANFDIGLYFLDTPRFIGEQLYSLALLGGRNIITEKGALVPQYGYQSLGAIDSDDGLPLAITKDNASSGTFFVVTSNGTIYLYTANEGLKKYKTSLDSVDNPLVAHRGKDLIIHDEGLTNLFGAYYPESSFVSIVSDVTLSDFTTYYQFTLPLSYIDYFWTGKELSINGTDNFTVTSIDTTSSNISVTAIINGEHKLYSEPVSIGEQTLHEILLTYTPEDEKLTPITIEPELIEVSQNRLFVVDISGRIYYSQIGVIDGFQESLGAGYFQGFYQSTSKTLSLEDFLDGTLICKEDGIYYLTLESKSIVSTQTSGGQSQVTTLATSQMEVSIKKIANIGQKYASDHVVERENVYAYDTNTGNIVNAVTVNLFGNLTAGQTIIDNRALDVQANGIESTKRFLTYNGQENIFTLYYGENLNKGIILTTQATIFPRELDLDMIYYIGFNQGVVGITFDGKIIQDYKIGTIIENLPAYADFEAIGLRDNRLICSTILEVTELNGVDYTISASNAGSSTQFIHPVINRLRDTQMLPPLIYSDKAQQLYSNSFELTSKWADKKSTVTRIYAPMSGRDGVQISIEFPKNVSFCLAAIRLPDFSQGE